MFIIKAIGFSIGFIIGLVIGLFQLPMLLYWNAKYGYQLGKITEVGEYTNDEIRYLVQQKILNPKEDWEVILAHYEIDKTMMKGV